MFRNVFRPLCILPLLACCFLAPARGTRAAGDAHPAPHLAPDPAPDPAPPLMPDPTCDPQDFVDADGNVYLHPPIKPLLDPTGTEQRAEAGDARARFLLGLHYAMIGATPEAYLPSRERAVHWLTLAAKQGSLGAERILRGYEELRPLEESAHSGDAEAQYELANRYTQLSFWQQEIDINEQRANYWYARAADNGHLLAALTLGLRYNDAFDTENAVYWLTKAVEQDSATGEYMLGHILLRGDRQYGRPAAPEDAARGLALLVRAAERGSVPAQLEVGELYLNGKGLPLDNIEAWKWLSLAYPHLYADTRLYCGDDLKTLTAAMSPREREEARKRRDAWLGTPRSPEPVLWFLP